jgi:NADH:ubiquinone oxidoreductase subunit F (NADH-binding)
MTQVVAEVVQPNAVAARRAGQALPPAALLPRLLPAVPHGDAITLGEHIRQHGHLPSCRARGERADILAAVDAAGLTGRGGAGFPTARKLAAAGVDRSALIIANGTEGEPASAKDKVLLARQPHLVLDGMVLAARLTGAREAVIVAHRSVAGIVAAAIAERTAARLDDVLLTVQAAAWRFVGGEATAVANWVANGTAVPLPTPPRLTDGGPTGRPTLVQNVETLAHLALIGRYGADWFRTLGTPTEPGSMLVTVAGAVRRPGVYEIPLGIALGRILDLAGGLGAESNAFLLGGYSGTWAPPDAIDLPFSKAGLAAVGAAPGAGLIAAVPADVCGLVETARVADYLAAESAGQCGPCVFGLAAIAAEIARIAAGRPSNVAALHRWLDQVDGRGACGHPSGVVRFVRSALHTFAAEIASHNSGWCCGSSRRTVLPVPGDR